MMLVHVFQIRIDSNEQKYIIFHMRVLPSSLANALSASTVIHFHYDSKAVQHVADLQFGSLLFLYGA